MFEEKLFNADSTMNVNTPLAKDKWNSPDIDWRYFSSVARPTITSNTNHEQTSDRSDKEYQKSQNTSRTLCQATKRGTLVDFLDEFERESKKHTYHRNLVSAEQRVQMEYKRNVRPLIVKRDIGFTENGSIIDKRQIQSQYWQTSGYTLFVSIASWLTAKE